MLTQSSTIKEKVFAVSILILISGSLTLALIDKDSRSAFTDLAKVGLGGYVAILMPKPKV